MASVEAKVLGVAPSTYRLDVQVCKLPDQPPHRLHLIIDAAEENTLVANNNALLKQILSCLLSDPRDLIGMVDVSMQANLLAHTATQIRKLDECLGPLVIGVDDAAGGNSESLRSEPNAADVLDIQKSEIHVSIVKMRLNMCTYVSPISLI